MNRNEQDAIKSLLFLTDSIATIEGRYNIDLKALSKKVFGVLPSVARQNRLKYINNDGSINAVLEETHDAHSQNRIRGVVKSKITSNEELGIQPAIHIFEDKFEANLVDKKPVIKVTKFEGLSMTQVGILYTWMSRLYELEHVYTPEEIVASTYKQWFRNASQTVNEMMAEAIARLVHTSDEFTKIYYSLMEKYDSRLSKKDRKFLFQNGKVVWLSQTRLAKDLRTAYHFLRAFSPRPISERKTNNTHKVQRSVASVHGNELRLEKMTIYDYQSNDPIRVITVQETITSWMTPEHAD